MGQASTGTPRHASVSFDYSASHESYKDRLPIGCFNHCQQVLSLIYNTILENPAINLEPLGNRV